MKSITSFRVSHYSSQTYLSSGSIKSCKRFTSTKTTPKRYYDLDSIASQFNVKQLDDWYKVKVPTRNKQPALPRVLVETYPEHKWFAWKFEQYTVPKNYWNDEANIRAYIEWAAKELGVQKLEDWYSIEGQQFGALKCGTTVLGCYGGSLSKALKALYPDHEWDPGQFEKKPSGFWQDTANHKKFIEELGKKIGVQKLDDWYQVGVSKLQKNGGGPLLNLYNCSTLQMLSALYPEHKWVPWKFGRTPSGYWDNLDNLRDFFDDLGKELGIQKPEDWYQVRYTDLFKKKRHFLLTQKFGNSLYAALSHIYPEVNWVPWYFEKTPKLKAWNDPKMLRQLIYEAAEKLHVFTLDDWYRVSRKQLEDLKMRPLLSYYGGLYPLLKLAYPQHTWDRLKLGKSTVKKSSQRWLLLMVSELFPRKEIIEDYMHPEMQFSSKRKMQLDVFVPAYSIAFEFHGVQHYQDIGYFSPQIRYQARDDEKKVACAAHKITLVEVPFWWDRTAASLAATIKAIRPDIPLPEMEASSPIPSQFTGQTSHAASASFKTKKTLQLD